MYVTLRDRPARAPLGPAARASASRGRVPSVVVTLGVVSLLTDVSSEAVAAVLPIYLTAALGLSTIAYGIVDGLLQGMSALVRVGGGWAADRGDRPKWVALTGYGLSALTRGGLLLATGFAAVTALVAVDRVGKGIRTAPRDAMISAAADPDHVARAFGVHRMLDTIGAALGPLLAFLILWAVPDGYRSVFVLSLGCAVLGVAVLGLLAPDARPRRDRERAAAAAAAGGTGAGETGAGGSAAVATRPVTAPVVLRHLADPRLRRLLLVAGALGLLTVGDGFVYLALQTRDGFATTWFPLLYVGSNVVYLLLAIPVGRLADRAGRGRVLVAGHVALVGAYLCAGLQTGWAGATVAALVLIGVFYAATDGVLAAIAGRLVDPDARATAIASAQTVVAVARMLASIGFGLLWHTVGRGPAMLAIAGLLVAVLPVCWWALRPVDRAPSDVALPVGRA